jgi:hypothetical protein
MSACVLCSSNHADMLESLIDGDSVRLKGTDEVLKRAPGMEQPANQPSTLFFTSSTVGHTTLKSGAGPSRPAHAGAFQCQTEASAQS